MGLNMAGNCVMKSAASCWANGQRRRVRRIAATLISMACAILRQRTAVSKHRSTNIDKVSVTGTTPLILPAFRVDAGAKTQTKMTVPMLLVGSLTRSGMAAGANLTETKGMSRTSGWCRLTNSLRVRLMLPRFVHTKCHSYNQRSLHQRQQPALPMGLCTFGMLDMMGLELPEGQGIASSGRKCSRMASRSSSRCHRPQDNHYSPTASSCTRRSV
mmetsp:Transcript_126492/g.252740  ORF Transcript_126492/g.252740 Transcript_126492/m.252740 type:complete len:215 (+) Transcript_126492:648-1292(+)